VSFARSGLDVRWGPPFQSLLELAEACDVPVRWSCRTGVCHNCETALVAGAVSYQEDAVLEYPQSGERIRGRRKIQSSRAAQPNRKRFTVRRIIGTSDLWVTEFVLTYDGRPSYTVSIMEFLDGKVARETQYFGDPFEPGPSRAQWVERMPGSLAAVRMAICGSLARSCRLIRSLSPVISLARCWCGSCLTASSAVVDFFRAQ
jgi:hypothetical protein